MQGAKVGSSLGIGARTVVRIVADSMAGKTGFDLETFQAWIEFLYRINVNAPDETIALFVMDLLPPILESAEATVLLENLDVDPAAGIDAVRLLQLALHAETVARFETLFCGLAERLLAPDRGELMRESSTEDRKALGECTRPECPAIPRTAIPA